MKIELFELERVQSIWENVVKYNLTESGVHPYTLDELLSGEELRHLLDVRIGYGHTNGTNELRSAIAAMYPSASAKNVLVTNGSAEANYLAVWSHLEPGDELVLMLPNYMQIWGLARSFGITVKPFHLREDLGWAPDLDELKCLISPKTKMIAVCNPNNPTGAVLSRETMLEIVRLADSVGAWIYSDEVYRGAEFSGEETTSFFGLYDKAMVAHGLSKAYGLPGLRIGWLAGPKKSVEKCWSYRDYTTIASGALSGYLATLVLQPARRKQVLERNRSFLRENLKVLTAWVNSHADILRFIPPKAGGIAFLHYNLNINSRKLSTQLREDKSVFILDGDCFGMDHYVRLGIGSEKTYFQTGLELIDEFLEENKF